VLLDFQSSGGTYVNGERVHHLHVLHDGDTIDVADERFEFYAAMPEGATGSPAPPRSSGSGAPATGAMGVLLFRELQLTERELTIGRAPGNQLVIEDPRVSSDHAKVIRVDDDFWLLDLGSSNGTFVNEQPVRDVHLLRDGDTIAIGATIVTFKRRMMRIDDAEPEVEAPPSFVFADVSGRRWVRVRILAALGLVLLAIALGLFVRFILQ
jgi:pSer/pThr/pTyr-binding forkhead associated (FHA) protein